MAEILNPSECVNAIDTTVLLGFVPLVAFTLFLIAFKRDVPIAGIFGGVLMLMFGIFLNSCEGTIAFIFVLAGVSLTAFFALQTAIKGHF